MDTFRSLRDRLDLTIIIVTHDPRIAEQVDRVVAIRDGKISTETIRQVSQLEKVMAGSTAADAPKTGETVEMIGGEQQALTEAAHLSGSEIKEESREHITLQEFVVLDSAGRLQIPKELREELGIGKRAQLEMGDNCIIIRPVIGQGDDGPKKMTLEEQIAMLYNEQQAQQQASPVKPEKRGGLFSLRRRK
jgi:peptide/nickel transport system ATP-binding protein